MLAAPSLPPVRKNCRMLLLQELRVPQGALEKTWWNAATCAGGTCSV